MLGLRIALVSALVAIGISACNPSGRPTIAQWQPKWIEATEVIPAQSEIGTAPDPAVCESTIAALRTRSVDLLPTPDVAIDDSVRNWLEIAEDAFFDCPPRGDSGISSFDDAYAEMDRLASEIDLVLKTGS